MKAHGGAKVHFHPLSTSALDGFSEQCMIKLLWNKYQHGCARLLHVNSQVGSWRTPWPSTQTLQRRFYFQNVTRLVVVRVQMQFGLESQELCGLAFGEFHENHTYSQLYSQTFHNEFHPNGTIKVERGRGDKFIYALRSSMVFALPIFTKLLIVEYHLMGEKCSYFLKVP